MRGTAQPRNRARSALAPRRLARHHAVVPHPTLPTLALLALLSCLPLRAHEVAAEMNQAARTFLDVLDAGQRKLALYPLSDAERENWNFVPLARQGVPFKRLTTDQQARGHAITPARRRRRRSSRSSSS
jgi:hypothetical protein